MVAGLFMDNSQTKLWSGRFTKQTDNFADHFHSSISFDNRLYRKDIQGSIAHVRMLGKQGIISEEDSRVIEDALLGILKDLDDGVIQFDMDAEDIHMFVESVLTQRIGTVGKRLHTGRSRNDQVITDMRLYVMEEISNIAMLVVELIKTLNTLAASHLSTIMPGYTHVQRAQPVTFAHHLLAYVEMLKRDLGRLQDTQKRTNLCPLGSGALATTTYPIDREFVAKELGFDSPTLNSMDSVSDRDFCLELLSSLSIIMMHLSRFCEELVYWSSHEFKFIEMDDAYATGSSIMPQKKNPDMAELIRGKTGRVYGDLMGLLTVMKGLPLAYNTDMQEDKEAVFDAIDTAKLCLPVFNAMISTITVRKANMYKAAGGGFTNATDAADWLVKKGLPFRDAHEVIGKLVLFCLEKNCGLEDLSLDELKSISDIFDESVYDAITLETCVNSRNVLGGPAKENMEKLIQINNALIKENFSWK